MNLGSPSKSKLVLLGLLLVFLISSVALYLKFIRPLRNLNNPTPAGFAISINGDPVSWEEFNDRVRYAKVAQNITDDQAARKVAYASLVERYVLLKEVGGMMPKVASPSASYENSLFENDSQYKEEVIYSVIREEVSSKVVSQRDFRYIVVTFGWQSIDIPVDEQRKLALSKITYLYNLVKSGESFESVGQDADADQEIKILNGGVAYVIEKKHPRAHVIYSEEFTKALFNLKEGEVTPVITIANDPTKWGRSENQREFAFAFGTVDKIQAGSYPLYDDWLKEQIDALIIVSNI